MTNVKRRSAELNRLVGKLMMDGVGFDGMGWDGALKWILLLTTTYYLLLITYC